MVPAADIAAITIEDPHVCHLAKHCADLDGRANQQSRARKLVIYFGGAAENVICVRAACGKPIKNKVVSQRVTLSSL